MISSGDCAMAEAMSGLELLGVSDMLIDQVAQGFAADGDAMPCFKGRGRSVAPDGKTALAQA
jgi:hypothetical protein